MINKNSFIICGDLNEEKEFFERLFLKEDLSLSYWEKIFPCFGNEFDSKFNIKNFGVAS